jgi:hypothetical protein
VEAVIALPVFVILFVAAIYVRDLMGTRHEVGTQARTCAWLYSANNCTSVPPGCSEFIHDGAAHGREIDEIVGGVADELDVLGSGMVRTTVELVVNDVLEAAFGKLVDSQSTRAVRRPPLFGGSEVTVPGRYRLACNVQPQTLGQILEDAWGSIWRGVKHEYL